MQKKIALLHRYPSNQIKETNAAFPYLQKKGIDVLTFKKFDRLNKQKNFWKSLAWIFYAPMLVFGKGYDVIYCDDSFPFYPALVKLASPKSRVIIRLGDLHLMYYYSGMTYKILHFFEKIAWLLADQIVPISTTMADYLQEELVHYDLEVINDPVDPDDFHFKDNGGDGSIMFHGVLTKNKNVDVLLDAARLLPTVDFIIIGDGPDLKRLKKLAPRNVYFDGWIPFKDVPRRISGCSVGVALRSDNPGNEYVVTSPFLQYGILGKPCLVTRRKVFGDYPWQFKDVYDLVGKIQLILVNPKKHGEELREYVLKNHEAKVIAEEIWELLKQA